MYLLELKIFLVVLFSLSTIHSQEDDEFLYGQFPDGFMWGLGTFFNELENRFNENSNNVQFSHRCLSSRGCLEC